MRRKTAHGWTDIETDGQRDGRQPPASHVTIPGGTDSTQGGRPRVVSGEIRTSLSFDVSSHMTHNRSHDYSQVV